MKKVILLSILLGMMLSCSTNRKAVSGHNPECFSKLDSLSMIMEHIKFGVYSVNLDAFSIEKYKGLSDLELAIKGVPLDEYGQHIHEFEKFIKVFSKDTDCLAITSEILIKYIGEPYSITPSRRDTNKVTYRYLFNIGRQCPNCNEPIHRIFDGCSSLRFYFEYEKLKIISYALY